MCRAAQLVDRTRTRRRFKEKQDREQDNLVIRPSGIEQARDGKTKDGGGINT